MQISRIAAVAGLAVAIALVAVILIGGNSSPYVVTARFPEAGQLVKGGLVQLAGRDVGKIKEIRVSDDGVAEVVMNLTDDEVKPLRTSTRAEIRAVGLASVANRFVELRPGASGAEIPDDGVLDLAQTKGIVDLDQLLNTFDDTQRRRLQGIIAEFAKALRQPTTGQLNRGLRYFDPALFQMTELGRELTLDEAALNQLVATASNTVRTLAQRPDALGDSIANSSRALRQLADRRDTLGDSLERAPAVFDQTTRVLRGLETTLPVVDPVLRGLRPAAPGLTRLLRRLGPVVDDALPTFAAVQKLIPRARKALDPIPALAKDAVPALVEGKKGVEAVLPIAAGLRPYTPDLVAGFLQGFGGAASGYYDANGHYARIAFAFGSAGLPGLIPPLPGGAGVGLETGLTNRCPGAGTRPAPDKSNPYVPEDKSCDEGQTPK